MMADADSGRLTYVQKHYQGTRELGSFATELSRAPKDPPTDTEPPTTPPTTPPAGPAKSEASE
jgi:hypothetical protein